MVCMYGDRTNTCDATFNNTIHIMEITLYVICTYLKQFDSAKSLLGGKMLLILVIVSNIQNMWRLEAVNLICCSRCAGWICSTHASMCTSGQVAAVINM